ncbi:MAG: ATP-grasp domain-containing protein [Epsilonproteobacteria bacterium]|nr:ATP-grasp domain-containing protein [Campylobacterota bacterium]
MKSKNKKQKFRVGVLMGGKSIEREVSFNSGRTICDHLDTQRYEIIPIFQTVEGTLYLLPWHFLHRGKICDFAHRLEDEATKITWDSLADLIDFAYLAMHGRFAEDGTLQGMLEVLGIPYLGAKVRGSAVGIEKGLQKNFLHINGIKTPHSVELSVHEAETITPDKLIQRLADNNLSLPCVVKPVHEGSSLGVTVVHREQQLLPALTHACAIDPTKKQNVIIEEYISGKEFVCIVLQKKDSNDWFALPITHVIAETNTHLFDYDQKYMPGRATKITPAPFSPAEHENITKTCIRVAQSLEYHTTARIDGFLTNNGDVVIIDPNILTGMAPSSFIFNQAAEHGMSHTDLINYFIERELCYYGKSIPNNPELTKKDNDMIGANKEKIRVGVLLGGDSHEREISLESGRNVCYKLSPHKYDVTPIFVDETMKLYKLNQKLLVKNSTREIAGLVTPDIEIKWAQLPDNFDFIFLGLHGGRGENGAVQGTLEMLGLPYNGPGIFASALCIDKYKTNAFLRSKGFDVPSSQIITKDTWQEKNNDQKLDFLTNTILKDLTFPLIVKPHDDGCSVMVDKATNQAELLTQIDKHFTTEKTTVMLEEFIQGLELTCGVIGNDNITILPASQAIANKGILSIEEKFLPGQGENQTPAPLPTSARKLLEKTLASAYKTVNCSGYARIDCFYQDAHQSPTGKERIVLLEFNTLPGLTPATCLFHQAAEIGLKPMELIDTIVSLGFEQHKKAAVTKMKAQKQGLEQETIHST